jgi:hypothetical protein
VVTVEERSVPSTAAVVVAAIAAVVSVVYWAITPWPLADPSELEGCGQVVSWPAVSSPCALPEAEEGRS